MHFTSQQIESLDQRYRATLINSLGGFKSLALIGTLSRENKSNLAIVNSVFHLGAHPPLFGFIIRPDSVERHTLTNILATRAFTLNHVNESIFIKAHQTSARYPAECSEFDETKLGELYRNNHHAPFVKESNVQIAAELVHTINIAINGTIMIIGRITDIYLPDDVVSADGFVDLVKTGTITNAGLDAYYSAQLLGRLSYAKPGTWPQFV